MLIKLLIAFYQIVIAMPQVYGIVMPRWYEEAMEPFEWIDFDWTNFVLPGSCIDGGFASRLLLPLWPDLARRHPDLAVDLHTSLNPLDLLPGRYDAVIAVSDAVQRPGLVSQRLVPIAAVPVCAPAWLERGPPDFAAVPLLHSRARPEDWPRWLSHAGFRNVDVQGGSSFESIGMAMDAAAAGLGFAIAIEALLAPDLAGGQVVVAHPVARPTRRHFVLQHEARLTGDPALATFAAWLQARIAEGPGSYRLDAAGARG